MRTAYSPMWEAAYIISKTYGLPLRSIGTTRVKEIDSDLLSNKSATHYSVDNRHTKWSYMVWTLQEKIFKFGDIIYIYTLLPKALLCLSYQYVYTLTIHNLCVYVIKKGHHLFMLA